MMKAHSILRKKTAFGKPNIEIFVPMMDGKKINGTWLRRGHSNVIIFLNAAFRSKNQFASVFFAEYLADKFDIIAFDPRGHFKSEGYWEPGEQYVNDVNYLLQYAKTLGYKRVGICGRSAGGWASIMAVAKFGMADSVISISSPIDTLSFQRSFIRIYKYSSLFMHVPLRFLTKFFIDVRVSGVGSTLSLKSYIGNVSPIPLMLVYNNIDPVIGALKEDAEELFGLAKPPKKLVLLEEIGHGFELESFPKLLVESAKWFEETLK